MAAGPARPRPFRTTVSPGAPAPRSSPLPRGVPLRCSVPAVILLHRGAGPRELLDGLGGLCPGLWEPRHPSTPRPGAQGGLGAAGARFFLCFPLKLGEK